MSEWRPVASHPQYEVSDDGRVRRTADKRERVTFISNRGYRILTLWSAGDSKGFSVHRLVATAFHGAPRAGQVVRHLDGDQTNNAASNLAWGTAAENSADRHRHGTALGGKASQTHCKHGHPLSGDNLRLIPSRTGVRRICIECRRRSARDYMRRFYAAQKVAS